MTYIQRLVMQGFKSFNKKIAIPFLSTFSVVCGPNGSGKCLHPKSKVILADGKTAEIGALVEEELAKSTDVKKLDDGFLCPNQNGVEVFTAKSDMKLEKVKPLALIKRKSPGKLLRIKTRSGREVIVTKYHPLFTFSNGMMKSLKAEELQTGLKIATPRILDIEPDNNLDLSYFMESNEVRASITPELGDEVRRIISSSGFTQAEFGDRHGVPYNSIKGFLGGQPMKMGEMTKTLAAGCSKTPVRSTYSRGIPMKIPSVITEGLSRLLGYMISEGRSTSTNQIWFVNEDEKLVKDFCGISKNEFGLDANVFDYKPAAKDVIVFSKPLQVYLEKVFQFKRDSKSAEKTVPAAIMAAENSIVASFLGGLFDGDGYLHTCKLKNKNHVYFEYATASKELAQGIQTLLLRLGILSTMKGKLKRATNSKMQKKRYYSLYVYGGMVKKLAEKITFKSGKKDEISRKIMGMNLPTNPNTDLIPGLNGVIKQFLKSAGISIKKIRREYPKVVAYYENRCECSAKGILEVLEVVERYGNTGYNKDLAELIRQSASSDIFWDKIIELEEIDSDTEWVYDISVEGTHNFVADNIIVHNSNINDAICFVLGRTSAKSMRAERLHELIFHGGKSKEPADVASVTLYLDNSKREFPFEQDFITVTRKVNKNGVSVYRLNDETVTRQRVLDVLAAARIFPDGYNIILQGDVTQIIEMDPLERRSVIDEIAGIKEYDEKKAKSEKEFEKVEQKLKEVGVVLKERDETYKKLQQERDAALKYQNMTNELKKLRASIANKRLTQSEQSFSSLTVEVDAKEKAAEEMSAKLTELDSEIDKKEQDLELLMKTLFERSKKIKIVRDVEELRAKILRVNDKIEYDKRELSRLDMIISRLEGISGDQESRSVSEILKLGKTGVYGTIASLLRVDQQYQVAVEVAAGPHINDIIVDGENTAIECVNFLKNNKIGRATFLPLDKLQERLQSLSHSDTAKAVGWANDLIEYDKKYEVAFKFVFGSTLVVDSMETARSIGVGKTRMVTLDGDLVERSGAIVGGFYRKRQKAVFDSKYIEEYKSTMGALRTEIETLAKQSKELSKELEVKTELERSEASDFVESEKKRNSLQRESDALKRQRKTVFQERVNMQSELNKIKLQRARIEAERDNTKSEFSQYAGEKEFYDLSVEEMGSKVRMLVREIDQIGAVNMKAIEEFENFRDEFEQLRTRYEEVIRERDSIMAMIEQIESRKKEMFMKTFEAVSTNFKLIFKEMTHGDGDISLEEQDNIYSGLAMKASPHGKRLLSIDSMSGGEKTLTAMAFLFAIQNYKPAPFYIFDEVDAALDKANSKKIGEMIQRFSKNGQFILMTHNDTTIRMADQVYGVSMDQGESKIISVQLPPGEE